MTLMRVSASLVDGREGDHREGMERPQREHNAELLAWGGDAVGSPLPRSSVIFKMS